MNTIDIVENLKFQKDKFPEIYNSYKDNSSMEVATTLIQLDEYEKKNNIFILTENFEDIVFGVFNIPRYMLMDYDLYKYSSIYIYKDFEEKLDSRDDILEIYYPYVYNLNIDRVIVSSKIKRNSMNNVNTLFMLKNISLFEKSYLKNCQYKVREVNKINILKEELIKFKPSYNESELVEKINKNNLKENKNIDTYLDEQYKVSVSMDFIRNINKEEDKQISDIVKDLIIKGMRVYEKESRSILEKYLNNDFINNYKLVDSYLKNKNSLQKFLNGSFKRELSKKLKVMNDKSKEEFKPKLNNLPNSKNKDSNNFKSRNLVNLLNSDIREIDDHLSYALSSLIKSISDI